MIYALLAAIFGMLSVQFFALNFSIQGLNRAVIYTPVEILSNYVNLYDDDPSFTTDELMTHLDDYYQKHASRYCRDYEVEYYFYNTDDESMCLDEYCDAVEIRFSATLTLSYTYHRVMYYELLG